MRDEMKSQLTRKDVDIAWLKARSQGDASKLAALTTEVSTLRRRLARITADEGE